MSRPRGLERRANPMSRLRGLERRAVQRAAAVTAMYGLRLCGNGWLGLVDLSLLGPARLRSDALNRCPDHLRVAGITPCT
jgi:hypothetical protein